METIFFGGSGMGHVSGEYKGCVYKSCTIMNDIYTAQREAREWADKPSASASRSTIFTVSHISSITFLVILVLHLAICLRVHNAMRAFAKWILNWAFWNCVILWTMDFWHAFCALWSSELQWLHNNRRRITTILTMRISKYLEHLIEL